MSLVASDVPIVPDEWLTANNGLAAGGPGVLPLLAKALDRAVSAPEQAWIRRSR